jgi:hypothetical protein
MLNPVNEPSIQTTSWRLTAVRWTCAAVLAFLALAGRPSLRAQSFYPVRPDDPRAVDFTKAAFGAMADGVGDDSDALQAAINRVQETTRAGVVLIPEGRYRLGKTVYVWQGIRLIGYGAKRPVFVLGRATPGYQEGAGRYMIQFADERPQGGGPIVDASEFTFYSGMSNVDFELQDGNPAAIAVRFHVAQHSALTHMNFQVGSARAAVEDIGNQASDIHVHGGEYGIITKRTAPVWQFLLMDSSFEGQRASGIHTQEAGFTLVRVRFANMPVALQIAPGEVEQLYARDLQLENIRDAAFVAGNSKNSHSAVTFTNIACSDVPRFFRGEEPIIAPSRHYVVERFSLGLEIGDDGRERGIALRHQERALSAPAPAVANDVPALPVMEKWVNVHTLGVKGDGTTDDTAALQAAIAQHPVLFFPSGNYRVRGSLVLKPDTVLIGLNPGTTQIALGDASPDFGGEGDPTGVIVAPKDGRNILSAISVGTGISNPRAVGVVWMAGPNSLMDDVSFPGRGAGGGGRGRGGPGGAPAGAPGAQAARGPGPGAAPAGRGPGARGPSTDGTQPLDLLITNGGGGIFRGNWPHGTNAKVGLRIENTSTPGKIYQMSVEHHNVVEAQFKNVRNWEVYAFQTEEENPAGAEAYALDVENCEALLFANTYMYRVSRNVLPKTHAIVVRHSENVGFENVKVFSQTRLAFDNAVLHETNGAVVRSHFFTHYVANRNAKPPANVDRPATVFGRNATLELLANGFSNVSGLTTSDRGTVFFTDAAKGKIYRWNEFVKKAEEIAEIPGQPQVLQFVSPNNLLAVANERAVYHLSTDGAMSPQRVEEIMEPAPHTVLLLPVGLHNQLSVMRDLMEHRGYVYRARSNTAIVSVVPNEPRGYFYAPGTRAAIMAGGTWRPILQSSQLAAFVPGTSHFLTSEDDGRTYLAKLENDGRFSTTVFAERGGNSVVSDAAGNVYIASGQVWIYDRDGKPVGVVEVPERPGSLAFGGPDKRTLFIGARGSLYAIRTLAAGN